MKCGTIQQTVACCSHTKNSKDMQDKSQYISPIKQRILSFASTLGISKRDFYSTIGVSRGTLESKTGITEDIISRFIAVYPEVNVEWLMKGSGTMLMPDGGGAADSPCEDAGEPVLAGACGVGKPYYDVDFLGGFEEIFNSQVSVPADSIIIQGFERADLWCNVTGHSMEPKISHGDIIALRQCTVDDVQYGEIYAVVLDTIRTIKILRRSVDPDKLRFIPINTRDYDEQEYPKSRIVRIFEVVGSVSKFF